MARKADGTAERDWRERLKRWVASTQTVAGFCRGEGVSVPSFYQWRRKLWGRETGGVGGRRGGREPSPRPIFIPVEVVEAVGVSTPVSESTRERVHSDLGGARSGGDEGCVMEGGGMQVNIELPNGIRIRVGADIDEARLSRVVRAILGASEC